MKSYDVYDFDAPLRLTERPTPQPKGSEVLLRVVSAAVCHSDLHIWNGYYDLGDGKKLQMADRGVKLPLTMGHETVGEVVAFGPDARGVAVGDRRLVFPWIGCGECPACRGGTEQLCIAQRFLGVFRPGGYSDHIVVPHARYLLPIGNLSPDGAALLACSGVTTYGALKKIGIPTLRADPIVIIGAGGLGLMCLSLLKALGGRGAIVVDIDPGKRDAALRSGALGAVDGAAADAVQQIQAIAKGPILGAIDLVGATATAELGMACVAKGGKVVIVGLFGGKLTLSLPLIPMRALSLVGSYTGSLTDLTELLELVQRTGLPEVPVTTRPLAEATEALNDLKRGNLVGRTVLKAS